MTNISSAGPRQSPAARRFQSVLIANRGEIACRIIRSCRSLGLRSIAIHSAADASAMHVSLADSSVSVAGAKPGDGYLDVQRIIAAAIASGAGAIHPGYGFLSEDAEFAAAVRAAGLVWIGPEPEQMVLMGDKARARAVAIDAGVPVVPGTGRVDLDGRGLIRAAEGVGFPLLVKAAAGGGGIGMNRVDRPEQLQTSAATTSHLAQRSFGDGGIYLERYVERARHIEVQVFGFGDGRVLHFGERDCSIQRRYQKIIEETPAPGLSEVTRLAMAQAALALASKVRYRGAGTIEFIYDTHSGEFYFLEMNTRIQVEHPITEEVYGVDLVAAQLALELDEISEEQLRQLRPRGHAIECRLCAEDPARGFLPSPGLIKTMTLPEATGVRIDAGYCAGDRVSIHYDPMLAKVIAHGFTRSEAIERMRAALAALMIDGVKTNRDLLLETICRAEYAAGSLHTRFI
ncbi:MAG TPA: biotin carboxylase N-terminal domain-containing protein [Steroidobacter sp.]|uniref:acetyl-CoA carboxylase biotin carboxylase subunit n=1 Tax=Steroidobacter sp. TaxID=1978227 RepID=UPI002EDAC2F6